MPYSQAQADRVRSLLGGQPGITEKEMLGGNLAVGVHGEDLIVRVQPSETDALLREPGAKPFDLSGSRGPPAGWLLVSPAGTRTEAGLRAWVGRGVAYAISLPKKPPKKAKR